MRARIRNILAAVCPFVVRTLTAEEERLFREHYPNWLARHYAQLVVLPEVDRAIKEIECE